MEYDYDQEVPTFWFSSRFAMSLLGFLGFLTMNSQRVCMEVAMPCMLNSSALSLQGTAHGVNSTATPAAKCVTNPLFQQLWNASLEATSRDGEFVWSANKQQVIYDTFFWGYLLIQLPAGWLAERFGGKKIMGLFMLAASGATMLIPLASRLHYFVMIVLRFVEGAGAGVAYPAMHAFLGKWAPPMERSKMASIIYSGALIGTVLTLELAGLLCQYGFQGGWPSIFYVVGAGGLGWVILWMVFASETPLSHGRMNERERLYLIRTLSPQTSMQRHRGMAIPCMHVITSLPFIGIMVAHFTFQWTMYIFEYSIPEYMKTVLYFDIRQSSLFHRLPSLGLWFLILISGFWADKLRGRALLTTATTRRIMQMTGTIIPATAMAVFGFLNCKHWKIALSLLVTGQSLVGFQYSGFFVNHLDIAPAFAGALMGTSNAVGLIAGFVAPHLIRMITTEGSHEQWQTIFFISASLAIFGSLVFFFTGSGELQKWAIPADILAAQQDPRLSSFLEEKHLPSEKMLLANHFKGNDVIITASLDRRKPRPMLDKMHQAGETKAMSVPSKLASLGVPASGTGTLNRQPSSASKSSATRTSGVPAAAKGAVLNPQNEASSSEQTTSSRTPSVRTKSSRTSSVLVDTDGDELYSSLSESVV